MAKSKEGMTHPTRKHHREVFTDKPFNTDITFPESQLIDVLRNALKARKSRKAYSDWQAWEMLKSEVGAAESGMVPFVRDVEANPALYAAVTAVRAYLDAERATTKRGAKRAKSESKADGEAAPE